MKTRDQSIFDELFKRSLSLNYRTYDVRPLKEVSYPFVDFDDTELNFEANKTNVKGTVFIRINVWGLETKRKQTSEMANKLFDEALNIKQSDGYFWALNTNASQIRWQTDTSTNTRLKRAIVDLEFSIL